LIKRWAWPVGILVGALALRLILFTGIQGNDDRYYYASGLRLARGERPEVRDLFDTRVGYSAPVAVLFRLFGPRESCLILPNLAASLALVALAYAWGRRRFSEQVGRGAAVMVALTPIDVFYATAAFTDQVLAAWLGFGALLLDRSREKGLPAAAAAGLCFGAAYLAKESALVLLAPVLLLFARKEWWKPVAVALAVLAAVIVAEGAVYAVKEHDFLYRFHLAHKYQSAPREAGDGFLKRVFAIPSLCLNPLDPIFPYTGGLFGLAAAGAGWAFAKDRARSGALGAWWLGSGLLLALSPLTLFPFKPALELQPRMFAVMVLPGAVLASAVLFEWARPWKPRLTAVAAGAGALLALLCCARLHQDGYRWRSGPAWACDRLAGFPGATVVTDPRSAVMLRILSRDSAPWSIVPFRAGDPPPAPGTLLLECDNQERTALRWDGAVAPSWWRSESPPRQTIADLVLEGPRSLRGSRTVPTTTRLRRIYSPR
jgi:hypothetical protein